MVTGRLRAYSAAYLWYFRKIPGRPLRLIQIEVVTTQPQSRAGVQTNPTAVLNIFFAKNYI